MRGIGRVQVHAWLAGRGGVQPAAHESLGTCCSLIAPAGDESARTHRKNGDSEHASRSSGLEEIQSARTAHQKPSFRIKLLDVPTFKQYREIMKLLVRAIVLLAAILAGAVFSSYASHAAYPERAVRIVAPFAAGGGLDAVARILAQALTSGLQQQIIVDNRSGAAGRIGTEIVARAAPDGYTLLLGGGSTNAIAPAVYRNLPYDAVNDFAAVSLIGLTPYLVVVHPSLPANSINDLIALAKAKPGQLTFATGGNFSGGHLSGELLKRMAGINILHIPFKGGAPAMTALLGGQVEIIISAVSAMVSHVHAGRVRALGVTSAKRSPALPEVPTIGETLKGYDVTQWYGLFAPAKTPREIVARLHAETVKAIENPDVRKRLVGVGVEPVSSTPEQLEAQVKSEIAEWGALIKSAELKPE